MIIALVFCLLWQKGMGYVYLKNHQTVCKLKKKYCKERDEKWGAPPPQPGNSSAAESQDLLKLVMSYLSFHYSILSAFVCLFVCLYLRALPVILQDSGYDR